MSRGNMRQLGEIDRYEECLVAGQPFHGGAPARFVLKVDVGDLSGSPLRRCGRV